MWKSSVGAKADDDDKKDDDDWDTDPDFVNNVSEQEQRWGSKAIEGSGRIGVVKMDQLRQDVAQDDTKIKQESKRENFAYGYGGKFGVQTDRKDKSAVGHDAAQEKFVHSSQVDGKKGFGGQFGVQSDRQDKSAAGFEVEKKPPPAVSSKPKIEVTAGSAKNRFEQLAKENEEKSKQEAERVRQERNANDKRRQEEEAKLADAREAEAEKQAAARAAAAPKAAPAPVVKAAPAPAPVKAAPAPAPVKVAAVPPPPKQPEPEEEEQQPEPEPEPEPVPEPEPEAPAQEVDEWAEQPAAEEETTTSEAAPSGGSGLTAVALYDYQAGGPDEITFDPEEVITDIEQVDEGWWMGTCRGHRGLFPSNFVTLQ